ncbi:MAG: LegC family aminotransferase [Planctomycetaceae bacterium]|nr:LegC family aminotransferase [Planctomycetaceae bacterium]
MAHTPDSAAREPIPLCTPVIGGNAWKYVKDCLDTGWVSSVGSYVERFEQMTAQRLGAKHAVATSSGTAALHIALLAAGVQSGDDVLVSTLTFIATANSVRYCGARAVPIDAEPATWQIDPQLVADFCRDECRFENGRLIRRSNGRRVSAIVAADILGHPADFEALREIADRYHLALIEDAAESLGASYRGRPAGNLAHIGCLSFNGNKLITSGGGGMLVTDRDDWAEHARRLSTQAKDDPVEFVHSELAYNYRLSNLQAALGCAQLEQLDDHLAAKRRIAAAYQFAFETTPGIRFMPSARWAHGSCWLSTVLVDAERFGIGSRDLIRLLDEHGIQSRPLWEPMHRSAVHRSGDNPPCPIADRLYAEAVSLPSSVDLSEVQIGRVIAAVHEAANLSRTIRDIVPSV